MTSQLLSIETRVQHTRPDITPLEEEVLLRVLRSGNLAMGRECELLEGKVATLSGRRYGIVTNSGTTALTLLLRVLTKPGEEVVLPSYVCESLLHAIRECGLHPKFADVCEETCNLTLSTVRSVLSSHTRLIIAPHMFGLPIEDIEEICTLAPTVEDCAHTVGVPVNGKPVGGFGCAAFFSFYATKLICGIEGGAVTTNRSDCVESMRDLRCYRGKVDFRQRFSFQSNDLVAAIAGVQIARLPEFIQQRRLLASWYREELSDQSDVLLPSDNVFRNSCFTRFLIRVSEERRDAVRVRMHQCGVDCGIGVARSLDVSGCCPVSYRLVRTSLSLPIYTALTREDVKFVCATLKNVLREV